MKSFKELITKCANCCKTCWSKLHRVDITRIAKHFRMKYLPSVPSKVGEDGSKVLKSMHLSFLGRDNLCDI